MLSVLYNFHALCHVALSALENMGCESLGVWRADCLGCVCNESRHWHKPNPIR